MLTIHHLGVSQSDRIVWLMEELGLPYKLKWYERKANRAAPDEYLALHPVAMAPVIEDGGRVLVEALPFAGKTPDDLIAAAKSSLQEQQADQEIEDGHARGDEERPDHQLGAGRDLLPIDGQQVVGHR